MGNPVDRYRRINIFELGSLTRWTEIRKKNRLIDENAHLNRQAVALARDEFQHTARHGAEKIAHKVSKRSIQSKCSHESSDDELLEARDRDADSASSPVSPSVSPPPAGLEHGYAQSRRGLTPELGDAMGQDSSGGGNGLSVDGDYVRRSRSYNYTPQSYKSVGSDTQPVRGQSSSIDNLAIPMESSRRGIAARTGSSQGKHKVADDGLTDGETARTGESQVTNQEFEDVDLSGSGKKTAS